MRKIHVAFFSANAYALFNPEFPKAFGGAEVDQYNLSVYLAKNPDIDVTFYVGDFGQTDKPETIDAVRLQKIPLFGWHEKSLFQKITFYSHLLINFWKCDADIILTEMAGDLVGWAAIFFKILRKKHMIHRLASDRDTEYIEAASSGGMLTFYLYRLGLKKADLIFSQTKQQQLLLKKRMEFNSQVVPNGFPMTGAIDFQCKKYVLWVGRCVAIKRPELFVALARQLPNQSFVMIMSPPSSVEPEAFHKQAAALVSKARSLPNMTFLEYVPFQEIQASYNHARLLVNTSEYEGFPNSFVQALMGGTPIASLKVDPDSVITCNGLGICCDNNFDILEAFVKQLDEKQVREMGSRALKYGRRNHHIEVMGKAYIKAIQWLLRPGSSENPGIPKLNGTDIHPDVF